MKNWKKFTEENRETFDSESPKDVFFEKIAPKIGSKKEPKMIKLSLVLQVAAAVIILFGVSLIWLLADSGKSESQPTAKNEVKITDEKMVLAKMNPELAETEYYYVSEIDRLMEEVENKKLTDDVKELLKQLDQEFNLLKNEMGEQVNSNQIIEAMIENYRLKIKLLEKILNSYSNENDYEKVSNS